ncbi:hypothetical protein N9C48_00335 [bacterium]|jgi:hypothetical protein|nr:hypothetical protein [bacterium]MDA9938537.1 hypothetical protein [bacterium]|tara:strand:+ start:1661 stop:2551 length:891 start_codon:yes stop_codon:yes gene_type:complete
MDKIKIIDQDIVFLSYDEPNAEKNYADLCSKLPWAKRVHGVDGSDAAHKACADISETEYFVTIDGDNIIDTEFLQQEIDIEQLGLTPNHVFSWCGNVHVNGLQYGNGGLKLWTRKFVNNMKTHENSNADDTKGLVEFCFDEMYYQFNDSYSISYTNASPFQAWRAGFREGVKMSLNEGAKHVDVKNIWWQNLDRLRIWCSIGADVENGKWSMLGARMGCYMTMCTDWDYTNVRDFKYLTDYWKDEKVADLDVASELFRYGNNIRSELNLEIADIDALGSKFFKSVYHNTPRIIKKR